MASTEVSGTTTTVPSLSVILYITAVAFSLATVTSIVSPYTLVTLVPFTVELALGISNDITLEAISV